MFLIPSFSLLPRPSFLSAVHPLCMCESFSHGKRERERERESERERETVSVSASSATQYSASITLPPLRNCSLGCNFTVLHRNGTSLIFERRSLGTREARRDPGASDSGPARSRRLEGFSESREILSLSLSLSLVLTIGRERERSEATSLSLPTHTIKLRRAP